MRDPRRAAIREPSDASGRPEDGSEAFDDRARGDVEKCRGLSSVQGDERRGLIWRECDGVRTAAVAELDAFDDVAIAAQHVDAVGVVARDPDFAAVLAHGQPRGLCGPSPGGNTNSVTDRSLVRTRDTESLSSLATQEVEHRQAVILHGAALEEAGAVSGQGRRCSERAQRTDEETSTHRWM